MRRTRPVHWRLAPSVVRALEETAYANGVSVAYLANYYLANCVRDKVGEPKKKESKNG